jgi:pimeloyl-ACP methyl ester carboxylesterase
MSMNRRQFFQRSTAVATLCADGMLPSLLEAQSPAAPLPGGAEAAAVVAINPPAGVSYGRHSRDPGGWRQVQGLDQAPWVRQDEGVAAAWRPCDDARYLEAMESFLPDAGFEMYYYDQLGCGNSNIPEDASLWTLERYTEEVEEVWSSLGLENFVLLWSVVGRHTGD